MIREMFIDVSNEEAILALRPIGILDDFSHATLSFIVQLFEEITCTFNSGSLEEREQCGVVGQHTRSPSTIDTNL